MKSYFKFWGLTLALLSLIVFMCLPVSGASAESSTSSQTVSNYYPTSCQEVKAQDPQATDGEYLLNLQKHLVHIYCTDMSGTPKEYLTLAKTGSDVNYSFVPGKHQNYKLYSYYFIYGTPAWTSYLKVRIDPTNLALDQKDTRFTNIISLGTNGYDFTNPSFNPTPKTADYGVAGECAAPYSAWARANVDLTGTDFAIDPNVKIQTDGFMQAGSYTMDANRQVLNMTGGGWCGGTGPVGPMKLSPTTPLDDTAPVTKASISGTEGQSGWYQSDVTVTLNATDDGIGVAETQYSLDNGATWTIYNGPFNVSQEGTTEVLYHSTDKFRNNEANQTISFNIDKTAPTLNLSLNKDTLWSPNHKLVDITVTADANDSGSGVNNVKLVSLTSNQLDNGKGDGNTNNDIQGADLGTLDTSFQLRAERSGNQDRIYTIVYEVTDNAGNTAQKSVTVTVPANQGKKK